MVFIRRRRCREASPGEPPERASEVWSRRPGLNGRPVIGSALKPTSPIPKMK